MNKSLFRRILSITLVSAALLLIGACGSEAPTYEPGTITVNSAPVGATILIDATDTGEITPHTFIDMPVNQYEVTVSLTDYVTSPTSQTINLLPLDAAILDFTLSQTGLTITSTPSGAAIWIDGADTGEVTPATIAGLSAGSAAVELRHDSFYVSPASYDADVVADQITELPTDTFILRQKKTVLLEGFSNVSCPTCPQLTELLLALVHDPAYSPDNLLFVEWAINWPDFLDPFYLANATENQARYLQYNILGAPVLYQEGLQVDPVEPADLAELTALVEASLDLVPGFVIDVAANFTDVAVPVTVTLTPMEDVDLTGYSLLVALIESEVHYEDAPGTNGQTEFHNVFRDRVDTLPTLGALVSGTPQIIDVTLNRGALDPAGLQVVAFVQHDGDFTIIQAGSTESTAKTALLAPGLGNN